MTVLDDEAERTERRQVMFRFLAHQMTSVEAWEQRPGTAAPWSPDDRLAIRYLWELLETLEAQRVRKGKNEQRTYSEDR